MADLRNRKNVFVGAPDVLASGGVLIGKPAKASQVPADATVDIAVDLEAKPAGHISQDGVVKTVNRNVEKIKDWNGDTVVTVQSEHDVTMKLTFLESGNAEVLKALYGEQNVQVEGNKIVLKDNADELPFRSFTFDVRGAEDAKIRVFVPNGKIVNIGDVSFVKNDVIKYEVEIECFTDDNNVKCYQMIDRKEDED